VLIGGLGMGFTVRAALDTLAADARVVIGELVPEVVAWNRGPLAPLAGAPLEDPRVEVIEGDVAALIGRARGSYDAILLDVDNGPDAFTAPSNANLYGVPGLERARRALVSGGRLGVWSVEDDRAFTGRMRGVGFAVDQHRIAPHPSSGARHVLWIGRAP
jgi:spermidine synthase